MTVREVTVSIDYSTPLGQVRLLIADTDETNEVLTDSMIAGFLGLAPSANVRLAAAEALDAIAISEALVLKVMTTLDVTTDGASLARVLQGRAAQLRQQVADGVDGGGDFDIADVVVDGHTAAERLFHELERNAGGAGWPFDPEYGIL